MSAGFSLENLVRPNIWKLAPYTCARDEFQGTADVMLDANENAYGTCVAGSLDLEGQVLERYPCPRQPELKEKIARLRDPSGVLKPENIFLGVGSDEAVDLLIRIFCRPGEDAVLQCPPTYGMYKVSAATNDIQLLDVPLLPEVFQLDVPAILRKVKEAGNVKIIFVCSPNNPTGNAVRREDVEKLLASFNGIVVVDEAYVDFSSQPSWCTRVAEYPNLVVMQTLSKAFGLAAARVGIAYSSPAIINVINKVKAPYNMSGLAIATASKAIDNAGVMKKKVALLLDQRRRLEAELPRVPGVIKVYPSDSNFLLVKVRGAPQVYRKLAERSVVVRDRSSQPLCGDCLRISVGTERENTILLRVLREVLSTAKL